MILVAVDDLMFSSKISTAAKGLGVEFRFVRSVEAVLSAARETMPRLVIFDLNSPRIRPLDAVAALKQDPALASVPTLGFVSHVQADLIEAARAAGIDRVMARSAFVTQLADILASPTSA